MPGLADKMRYYKTDGVRGLSTSEGLSRRNPITVRGLLGGPEKRLHHLKGELNAGDVNATSLQLLIQSDGGWAFVGNVFDHGDLYGDDFSAAVAIGDAVPGGTLVWSYSGNVGHQTWNNWSVGGFDDRIRDNWDVLTTATAHFDLEQSPELGGAILDGFLTLTGIKLIGQILWVGLVNGGQAMVQQDHDGTPTAVVVADGP